MPDPFLEAHALGHLYYGIGGKLSPVSIRDQMLRGRVLVDRAKAAGLIDRDRPLLVVGAGAGGVTAALHAAGLKIPTTLIDKNKVPFARQRRCRTRWISPTQYDWPLDHWELDAYPWEKPDMPLQWAAEYSNLLTIFWLIQFNSALSDPNLSFLRKTKLDWSAFKNETAKQGSHLDVAFKPQGGGRFGMVIFGVGPGTEVCTSGNYRGFRFWETDSFEKPRLGLATAAPKVLISGGGDGALQDYLRVITKKSAAKDVFNALPASARSLLAGEIIGPEQQAERAYAWAGTWEHDHEAHVMLHRRHLRAVGKLAGDAAAWRSVSAALDTVIDTSPDADAFNVELVHPCTHFSRCYGLNHLLVLLVDEYLARKRPGHRSVRPDTTVTGVQGIGHACASNAKRCFGEPHEVSFDYADCGAMRGIDPSRYHDPRTDQYRVVILRHGIHDSNPRGQLMASSRHILPYHVPWSA